MIIILIIPIHSLACTTPRTLFRDQGQGTTIHHIPSCCGIHWTNFFLVVRRPFESSSSPDKHIFALGFHNNPYTVCHCHWAIECSEYSQRYEYFNYPFRIQLYSKANHRRDRYHTYPEPVEAWLYYLLYLFNRYEERLVKEHQLR